MAHPPLPTPAAGVTPAVLIGDLGSGSSPSSGGFAISLNMYIVPAPNTAK